MASARQRNSAIQFLEFCGSCISGVLRTRRTGNDDSQLNDVDAAEASAASYRGSFIYVVNARTWFDWSELVNVKIFFGTGRQFRVTFSGLDGDVKSHVRHGEFNGWHACLRRV